MARWDRVVDGVMSVWRPLSLRGRPVSVGLEALSHPCHCGGVRLCSLSVENFRGFTSFRTDFHEQVTVLVGENGAGKSSLLDAAAVAIGSYFLGFPDIRPPKIVDRDIHRVTHTAHGVDIERVYPVAISATGVVDGQPAEWRRELRQAGGKTTHGEAREIQQAGERAWKVISSGAATDVPVLAYYGAGRLWEQKRESSHKAMTSGSRSSAYVDCLEPASNHKLFEAWMKLREQERLQALDLALAKGLAAPTIPAVEAVCDVVRACVAGATRIFFSVAHNELRVEFEDGRVLPFSFLSDGYRNFLGMVADLAWRAARLNPHLGRDAPRLSQGVVLIDEVDLHLHPRWQWSVAERLTSAFPSLQFVLTTHSPQVIASCKAEWLRILPRQASQATGVNFAQGKDINAILADIMDAPERLPAIARDLARVASQIEDNNLAAARPALESVAALVGEDDARIIALRWELAHANRAHDGEPRGE
jgi:predicted ATP-binding protein involved in virulence